VVRPSLLVLGDLRDHAKTALSRHVELTDDSTPNVLGIGHAADDAVQLALEHPDRMQALVLVSPSSAPAPDLTKLDTPTLVVVGTREPAEARTRARRYRELIPSCYLVLVYDAGEDIQSDRPQAFASLVTDFLQRREAFVLNNQSGVINP
jgi:pimeloyl-ACP methyl ester carboxylesterase